MSIQLDSNGRCINLSGDTTSYSGGKSADKNTLVLSFCELLPGRNCCDGSNACDGIGENGNIQMCAGSCVGDNACSNIGTGDVTIGPDSCIGVSACEGIGSGSADEVIIGRDACKGSSNICQDVGSEKAPKVEISYGACTNDCKCGGKFEESINFAISGSTCPTNDIEQRCS